MIDRRIFLQLSSGAAAGATAFAVPTAAVGAEGGTGPAPRRVHVAPGVETSLADPLRILRERLELASGGRLLLSGAAADAAGAVDGSRDLILSDEGEFADGEPLSLLLGGYPFNRLAGLLDVNVWLKGMGGQALWDMSAARHGWKPLMIAMTARADVHVWRRPPDAPVAGRSERRVVATRALRAPLEMVGVVPCEMNSADLVRAFEAGEIDVFETDDPAISLAAAERLGRRAEWIVGSLAGTGRVLSLRVPIAQWQGLSIADRALMEAVAQETVVALHAIRRSHNSEIVRKIAQVYGRAPWRLPYDVRGALTASATALLPSVGRDDPFFAQALITMAALTGAPVNDDAASDTEPSA